MATKKKRSKVKRATAKGSAGVEREKLLEALKHERKRSAPHGGVEHGQQHADADVADGMLQAASTFQTAARGLADLGIAAKQRRHL